MLAFPEARRGDAQRQEFTVAISGSIAEGACLDGNFNRVVEKVATTLKEALTSHYISVVRIAPSYLYVYPSRVKKEASSSGTMQDLKLVCID